MPSSKRRSMTCSIGWNAERATLHSPGMPTTDHALTLEQAERLAKSLMREHGVTARGWRFAWSRGKRRLGETSIRQTRDRKTGKTKKVKQIRLSRYLVERNPEPVVRDVILHEIAHALAGIENGHNAKWKAACKRVGAKPQRLADESVQVVEAPYAIICSLCDAKLGDRHRRASPKTLARSYCKHCGKPSMGKLKLVSTSAGQ